jgi:hypothetical protein
MWQPKTKAGGFYPSKLNQLYDNVSYEADERKSDGVFGVPIDKDGDIPPILCKFIRYLSKKGPSTEYIFKITPPPGKEILNLKRKIKLGKELQIFSA